MILKDDTSIVNKFEASLTEDIRVVIYDWHMIIVQATEFMQILSSSHNCYLLTCGPFYKSVTIIIVTVL
jgi:hypothetical protein